MLNFWTSVFNKGDNLKDLKLTYCLNDAADLLVRIRLSNKVFNQRMKQLKEGFDEDDASEQEHTYEQKLKHSFYYYSAGYKNSMQGEYLFYDGGNKDLKELNERGKKENDEINGVSMNEKYIFFWSLGKVWKLDLVSKILSKMSLYIDEDEKHTFVKDVATGSDPDTVCIRVE